MKKIRSCTALSILLMALTMIPCIFTFFGCGSDLPKSLVALRQRNPETADFVAAYPTEGHFDHEFDLSSDYVPGEIPHLLQWDIRWGYENYGDDMIAITGCGPTCLSMAAIGLTGNTNYDPLTVAEFAQQNGYYYSGAGSTWTLISEGAQQFGLISQELPLDETVIRNALAQGSPIICAVGPGDFTTEGHFILITKLHDDGTVTVNDPNSKLKSRQHWSLPHIMDQIQNLWALSAA